MTRLRRILGPAVIPALAVLTAFIVGSVFILILNLVADLIRVKVDPRVTL